MLNADAIKLIQDTAIANVEVKQLEGVNIPTIVINEKASTKSIENLMPNRARYRAEINTSSVADFAEYTLSRKDAENRRGFIATNRALLNCEVIFNIGTPDAPGHCDDTAKLTLEPTAAYAAMRSIDAAANSQKDLAEWLEDWAENITAISSENPCDVMPLKKAIAAIRNIKINANAESTSAVGNLSETRSAMEKIEAKAAGENPLPEYFLFFCKPYDDLKPKEFKLSLSILTSQPPQLKLRWMQRGVDEESIEQEFKNLLKEKIGAEIKLTVGTFKKAA